MNVSCKFVSDTTFSSPSPSPDINKTCSLASSLGSHEKHPRSSIHGDAVADADADGDAYQLSYAGFRYESIPSSGRPGTPHRYFSASYITTRSSSTLPPSVRDRHLQKDVLLPTLHKNSNGLVVVTIGHSRELDNDHWSNLQSVELLVDAAPSQSQAGKRKQVAKMLSGKTRTTTSTTTGIVRPHDVLARLHFGSKHQPASMDVLCGVWGTVLEINENLSTKLLHADPLLNGFLAIILPTGPFPHSPTPTPRNLMNNINNEA